MVRESVESLCAKAQQALTQREYEQARQLYLQALGLRDDAPDVHYGLATVCFLLNDLTSAAHHFKECTRLDPLRAGAFINLGAVYNRMDLLDEAVPVLRRGIQIDHNRAEGFYNLGVVYRRRGQTDLAIQAYREAVRINPRMADAHYNLGNLYVEATQYHLAIAHYRHALELRPNWEKCERSLEQVEEARQAEHDRAKQAAAHSAEEPAAPAHLPVVFDHYRVVEPDKHGVALTSLHRATIDSEAHGRNFLRILEAEVEPAIKELSSCLLYPDSSAAELDQCVKKFESAIGSMRGVQRSLHLCMERVRNLGEQLLRS